MPKLAIFKKFIFFLYSSDLDERIHVHVIKSKTEYQKSAKFWLTPSVDVFKKGDFTEKEIREIVNLIEENKKSLMNQIERFRNGERIKTIRLG